VPPNLLPTVFLTINYYFLWKFYNTICFAFKVHCLTSATHNFFCEMHERNTVFVDFLTQS
jgi:hypothetical protein